jgi:rhomboid protease GluP
MGDFWKKLSKSLGINYTWWHWRWINFRRRWAGYFSTDRNVFRHLRSGQKICQNCGALNAPGDRRCSVCGARLPSATANFLYKIFGLVAPGVLPVTASLFTVIVLDFLYQVLSSSGRALVSPGAATLIRSGALYSGLVAAGQYWRLMTAIFVHIGLIHLAFNAIALVIVSKFLEEELGWARYLSIFLLTGLAGSAASYALHFRVLSAGASGAIFGLIGFAIPYFGRQRTFQGQAVRRLMIRWGIYAFVFGLIFGADNYAHAGGFVTGLLLGAVMEFRVDERRRRDPVWRGLAWVLGLAVVASFAMLIKAPR